MGKENLQKTRNLFALQNSKDLKRIELTWLVRLASSTAVVLYTGLSCRAREGEARIN